MLVATTFLAQVPSATAYFSYPKLAVVTILFFTWCAFCQWVDRDTDIVKTKREQWNLIVLSGGVAGLAACLLLPWAGSGFYLGLGFWIILSGTAAMMYVFHRNGRVVPDARVLTWNHLQRTIARAKGEKREKEDKGVRIQLADFEGKKVTIPEAYNDRALFHTVQDFLFDLMWRRATDVDLLIGNEKVRLFYKIDGTALEQTRQVTTATDGERILTYMKKLAGLNPEERRRPQAGRIKTALLGSADLGTVEVRVSGSTQGERLRLRVQAPGELKRLGELGLTPQRMELIKQLIAVPHGILLFSGPPEGGVTTTQYAVLREHDAFMNNIYTLERNPFLQLDNITQHPYRGEGEEGVSYARSLQTVLRREPDIVMVGECEDRDTAQIAARAADEKKIYMAIQAKDSIDALGRYMALVENNKLVAEGLLGVVNQRLIRVLCPACRIGYRPDPEKLRKLNLPADKIEMFYSPPTEPVFDKKGREIICQTCQGSGYLGRTGVFEVMRVDDNIRTMIANNEPLKMIKQQSRKARMHYLMEDGLLKVIDGTTSMDEILRKLRDEPAK